MSDTTRVTFTRPAAERIASVVRTVERGDRDQSALKFGRPVPADASGGGAASAIRIGTFTGQWNKNATATITLVFQTSTPNTFVATNLFADLSIGCGTKKCAIASEGSAWYLIQAEC